jgi:hypothetical protein
MHHHADSTVNPGLQAERYDLLECRMAMLGLDRDILAKSDGETFQDIRRRCSRCEFRNACAVDLKRDPNNPVWETYCPNCGILLALSDSWWITN